LQNQIEMRVPHYTHIFKVKPGITSLGMVKFGYASTVDEMVQRLKIRHYLHRKYVDDYGFENIDLYRKNGSDWQRKIDRLA
jgi:hypothetical protein